MPLSSQAALILASFGATDEVRMFDSVTGADVGAFASGIADPSGIGFDPVNGFVYVADFNANNVLKYTTEGTLIGSFGTGLSGPDGLTVDSFGNVYVSNYLGFNVKKFDSFGNLVTTISTSGRPEGMGFATNGDLLVNIYTGTFGGTIRRYDSSGVFVNTFASGMTNPLGMAVDSAGNVYVTNFGAGTVFKYSSSGTLVDSATLGYNGYGLAINELGELLVSNPSGPNIQRYDLDLNSLGTFATTATGPLYLAVVPEPSSTLLLVMGLGTLIVWRRRP